MEAHQGGSFFTDMAKNKIKYTKPPLTFDQQIEQLERRGMFFADKDAAREYLGHLNYYRLAAYWLPFEEDHETHRFKPDTCFSDVLNLYIFDRELRILVLDGIERIEVSLRTRFAYHMSHEYGPHFHLSPELFANPLVYSRATLELEKSVQTSKETFIRHLRKTYSDLLPPVWAVVELLTFSQLSKWYDNLKKPRDRKLIADTYDIDERIFCSFLHHLSIVRNSCAHHSRLWNREFPFTFIIPKTRPSSLISSLVPLSSQQQPPRKIYNTLVLMAYLLDVVAPDNSWKSRLLELINHRNIDVEEMGFPANYQTLPIWSAHQAP